MKKIILSLCAITTFTMVQAQWQTSGGNYIINNTDFLGTNNGAHLDFRTGVGSLSTQRMRITNMGLIGIGTGFTTPAAALHVLSIAPLTLKLESSGSNNAKIGLQSATNQSDILHYSSSGGQSTLLRFYSNTPGAAMAFVGISGPTLTEFFRVTDIGNFAIGTQTTDYKLHVKNSSTSSGTAIRADAMNGHIRLFETDEGQINDYTQIERNGNAFHIYQKDDASPTFVPVFTAAMDGNVGFGDATAHTDTKMFVENSLKNIGLCVRNTQTTNNGYGVRCIVNNNTTRSLAVTNSTDGLDVFRVMGNGVVWCTELNVDVKGDFPDYVFDKNYKLLPLDELKTFVETEKHLPNLPTAKEVAENGIAVSKMAVVQTEKIEELTLYLFQLNETMKKLSEQNAELQKRIVELESK